MTMVRPTLPHGMSDTHLRADQVPIDLCSRPIPPTHLGWRQDPGNGTSPSDAASALILPEHALRQPGQADLDRNDPAPQAARELWTNAEDDEVRSFIYWDRMLSWDRIGGIVCEKHNLCYTRRLH